MRISAKDFSIVVSKIGDEIAGKYIRKIIFYSSRIFFLQLSSSKRRYLIINLDNTNPSVFISGLSNTPPTLVNPLYLFLKKEMNNAYIVNVSQINNDR
ncbi:MAG: hypothetical protein WC014_03660, partial [Bacilli bacterium]